MMTCAERGRGRGPKQNGKDDHNENEGIETRSKIEKSRNEMRKNVMISIDQKGIAEEDEEGEDERKEEMAMESRHVTVRAEPTVFDLNEEETARHE